MSLGCCKQTIAGAKNTSIGKNWDGLTDHEHLCQGSLVFFPMFSRPRAFEQLAKLTSSVLPLGNASTDICLQRIVSSSALRRYKVVGHNINGGGNRRRNKSTERSNKAFRVTDVIVVDGGHLQTVLLTSRNSHR